MAANPIDAYRRQIERELQAGNATEPTFRTALNNIIESMAPRVTAIKETIRFDAEIDAAIPRWPME